MRKGLASVALIAVSLVVAWIMGEVALRLAGFSFPSFYRFDPDLGQRLIEGASGWQRKEGEAFLTINSDGLRDGEHTTDKPADTVRVAVLGDSYTEARHVDLDQTFWSIAERRLEACENRRGRRIELINFGVAGYGTTQELLMLRKHGWRYDPDLVLLAFFVGNDLRNNTKELQKGGRPYLVERDGELVLDAGFRDGFSSRLRGSAAGDALYWLLLHSRVAQLIAQFVAVRQAEREIARAETEMAGLPDGAETGLDIAVYREPQDEDWKTAWRITEAVLSMIDAEAKAREARFLLVTLSTSIQVDPDERKRDQFAEALGVPDLFYPDRRLMEFAQAQGIPALMLAPELRHWAEQNRTCVHGFANTTACRGHWNVHGHAVAGPLIADLICRHLP